MGLHWFLQELNLSEVYDIIRSNGLESFIPNDQPYSSYLARGDYAYFTKLNDKKRVLSDKRILVVDTLL